MKSPGLTEPGRAVMFGYTTRSALATPFRRIFETFVPVESIRGASLKKGGL
jgi:hypothetical protein